MLKNKGKLILRIFVVLVLIGVLGIAAVAGINGIVIGTASGRILSPEEAAELAKTAERCFVIGGGSVYQQMLDYCDTAYITKVHCTTDCDTWFPNLDEMDDWYLAETLMSGEENGIGYEMLLYKRKEK